MEKEFQINNEADTFDWQGHDPTSNPSEATDDWTDAYDDYTNSPIIKPPKAPHSKSKWRNYLRQSSSSDELASRLDSMGINKPRLAFSEARQAKDGVDTFDVNKTFDIINLANNEPMTEAKARNINDNINIPADERNTPNGIRTRKKNMRTINQSKDPFQAEDFLEGDELINIIHGGDFNRVKSFANNGNGAYMTNNAMMQDGKISTMGFMFHSNFTGRAKGYASMAADKTFSKGEAVLTGQVPKKYLVANNVGDEYSLPKIHWNKIQNKKIHVPGDESWENDDFYGYLK